MSSSSKPCGVTVVEHPPLKPAEIERFRAAFIAHGGDMATACQHANVSLVSAYRLLRNPEYQAVMTDARELHDKMLDDRLSDLMLRALTATQDRIDHGDVVVNKDGTTSRKPMSGKDLGITMAILYDKRALLRRQPTAISTGSPEDRLEALASKLEAAIRGAQVGGEGSTTTVDMPASE